MITVRVGRLPGRITEFVLEDGVTVAQALEIAELDPTGYEIRVNGATTAEVATLEDEDIVLLVKKIKGN